MGNSNESVEENTGEIGAETAVEVEETTAVEVEEPAAVEVEEPAAEDAEAARKRVITKNMAGNAGDKQAAKEKVVAARRDPRSQVDFENQSETVTDDAAAE